MAMHLNPSLPPLFPSLPRQLWICKTHTIPASPSRLLSAHLHLQPRTTTTWTIRSAVPSVWARLLCSWSLSARRPSQAGPVTATALDATRQSRVIHGHWPGPVSNPYEWGMCHCTEARPEVEDGARGGDGYARYYQRSHTRPQMAPGEPGMTWMPG